MFGFFEWISDDLSPPQDTYDPAIARPRCKKCGKDAWLMWNGKYSAYCSTECQRKDRRRESAAASSADNLLPSRATQKRASLGVFQRATAAKKAARDIKAIAKKWAARRTETVKDTNAGNEQGRCSQNNGENVHGRFSFAQRQAEEADFHKMHTRLAQVAEVLAAEQRRSQEEEQSLSSTKLLSTNEYTAGKDPLRCSSFLEAEAAELEQAFVDELRRQTDEDQRQMVERETHGNSVAESHDTPQLAQVKPGSSPVLRQCEDKATQAQVQTGEGKGSEAVDARSSCRRQRKPEDDKVSTGSGQLRDEKAHEHSGQGTELEVSAARVYREDYSHPLEEQHEQSTRQPDDKARSCSERRHVAAGQYWRGATRKKSEVSGCKRPFAKPGYARETRSRSEDKHLDSANLSDSRQDAGRQQQARDTFRGRSRSRTHRRSHPQLPVVHDSPSRANGAKHDHSSRSDPEFPVAPDSPSRAHGAKHDNSSSRKSRYPEKSHKSRLAKLHTKTRSSAAPQRDVASVAPRQNTTGILRVAGTADTYITLDDLHQLRDAAWRESKMAVEESCAWCVDGQYAGILEVQLQCAQRVNPSRVSPNDNLYIVVRCPVAEAEWREKRSKSVNNLKWEESLSFPVFYEKYPGRARACAQLWREAPRRGDADQFVGEGEIPFPRSPTRCALRVQLCWNTNLGGNVVDLDCGRLRLDVQLLQRTDPDKATSGLLQGRALSRKAQELVDGRQQTATLVQTRTTLKGTQEEMNVSRQTTEHSNDSREVEAVTSGKSVLHSRMKPDVEEEACITVKRGTDVERAGDAKRKSTRPEYPRGVTGKIVLEGARESSHTTDKQKSSGGRRGMTQQDVASVAEKQLESSNIEMAGLVSHQNAWVERDAEPTMQEKEPDVSVNSKDASATALPVSASMHSTSKSSPEDVFPTYLSKSYENMASSSAAVWRNTVKLDVGGVEVQETVSRTTMSFRGERQILDKIPSIRDTAVDICRPLSAIPKTGISEAELQVLLPVALAQMDDFARHGGEPECIPPAANLDPCILAQPWRNGHEKRIHCANRSCRRIISSRDMNDLFEEEEFRAWGCCSGCQAEMFCTNAPSYTDGVIQISGEPGKYDEFRLDSFIPVAFPSFHYIWPSSRHLYVAQRFTHVQIQDRLRQCTMQQELSLLLMAPLLKYFVRPDWSNYRHEALRTCIHLKIRQHPRLQLLLASTGRCVLYDSVLPDFWEWESEDEATHTNLAGKLLMELRKEYL